METKDKIDCVERYLRGMSHQDIDAMRALYADNATVEDPAGSEPHVGIEAICEFYRGSFGLGVKVERTGPVRCAANAAVFPLVAVMEAGGVKTRIDVIDIFEFDAAGKVQSMKAYWGPENMSSGD